VRIWALLCVAVVVAGGAVAAISFAVANGSGTSATQVDDGLPPLGSAGPFVLAEMYAKVQGAYARAWLTLDPDEQQLVPKALYVRCERATPFTVPFAWVRLVRVRPALVHVPDVVRPVNGAAVTIRVAFAVGYGPRDPLTIVHTFHVVVVDGTWRWLLSPGRYSAYRQHRCGAPQRQRQ
jgi:hypothetical protein